MYVNRGDIKQSSCRYKNAKLEAEHDGNTASSHFYLLYLIAYRPGKIQESYRRLNTIDIIGETVHLPH